MAKVPGPTSAEIADSLKSHGLNVSSRHVKPGSRSAGWKLRISKSLAGGMGAGYCTARGAAVKHPCEPGRSFALGLSLGGRFLSSVRESFPAIRLWSFSPQAMRR